MKGFIQQQVVSHVKTIAQQELKPRFANVTREQKHDGSFLTEADLAVQSRIESLLNEHYPDIPFMGEEMSSEMQKTMLQDDAGVWILDPLDGTSNFAAGIPYYAVSLAFVRQGQVQWGMVYDVERDECFIAEHGQGASLNDQPLHKSSAGVSLDKASALIDFKRLEKELACRLASTPPYGSQRSFGGVALDWCWLAAGRVHVYLHGKQNIWDYAAGNLVFAETGGYSCTLQGEPVFDYSLKPRSAVAALDRQLFEDWCSVLQVEC